MLHHLEPIAICDKFPHLSLRELKHELWGKTSKIPLYGFVQPSCQYMVNCSQIPIKHNSLAAQFTDERTYVVDFDIAA